MLGVQFVCFDLVACLCAGFWGVDFVGFCLRWGVVIAGGLLALCSRVSCALLLCLDARCVCFGLLGLSVCWLCMCCSLWVLLVVGCCLYVPSVMVVLMVVVWFLVSFVFVGFVVLVFCLLVFDCWCLVILGF